jgi:hypothetical protein
MPTKDDRLDQALVLLNEIKTIQATQGAELLRLAGLAKENKEAIKGNGKVGLEVNMALVQDSIKRTQTIVGVVASIVGAEIIALLFAILTHKIPLSP